MSIDEEFKIIRDFAEQNVDMFSHRVNAKLLLNIKNVEYLSEIHFKELKKKFINGRVIKIKNKISYPDPALYLLVKKRLKINEVELEKIEAFHAACMSEEDVLGEKLEEYIYSVAHSFGWIWCSGNIIMAIDFIKKNKNDSWEILQIKNSDNSENSSSRKVREGTPINMWFRRFSKKKDNYNNWDELNKIMNTDKFSEKSFLKFLER
jgi:hypothetical protein